MRKLIGLVAAIALASMACEDTPSTPPSDPALDLTVTTVEPTTIFIGEEFVITGRGFGLGGEVWHVGAELVVTEWTDNAIRAIAQDWREGPLVVFTQDERAVMTPPVQSIGVAHDIAPPTVEIGEEITITGLGFGDEPGEVLSAGSALRVVSWSDDVIRMLSAGLRDDEPLLIQTRDFGSVMTPPSTSVVPADLDMTEYRFAWGSLDATFLDYRGDLVNTGISTKSHWTPELEWDGLSFVGSLSYQGPHAGHSDSSEGHVEPSFSLVHGTFHRSWWERNQGDMIDFYSGDIEAIGIPLFWVESGTVEYRLVGDAVIDQFSAAYRHNDGESEELVRDPRHPNPVMSIIFTREEPR